MSKNIELLRSLRAQVDSLRFQQDDHRDACVRRTEMLARRIFGDRSRYVVDLKEISFTPGIWFSGMTAEDSRPSWDSGKAQLLNLIDTMIEDEQTFGTGQQRRQVSDAKTPEEVMERTVFIVHGHDEEMKQAVARALSQLKLQAVILHEQPNKGRTVIEKFMDYGQVASFAVVLLSPDDVAHRRDEDPSAAKLRARQNVIFELGFFVGKLGRSRVTVLHREAANFEIPSDYAGVLFLPYDARGTWRFSLAQELKAAGYTVDANLLI